MEYVLSELKENGQVDMGDGSVISSIDFVKLMLGNGIDVNNPLKDLSEEEKARVIDEYCGEDTDCMVEIEYVLDELIEKGYVDMGEGNIVTSSSFINLAFSEDGIIVVNPLKDLSETEKQRIIDEYMEISCAGDPDCISENRTMMEYLLDECIANGYVDIGDGEVGTSTMFISMLASEGIYVDPTLNIKWEVADTSSEWYNYDKREWANAALVNDVSLRTAIPGTLIPEEKVLAYYVWIPRYKYKLFNAEMAPGVDSYNALTTGIDIVFENDTETTGTVSCSISSAGVETCTNAQNGSYYTHPAFTFGNKQLRGIWVGKFEVSAPEGHECTGFGVFDSTNCNKTGIGVRIKPNVMSRVQTLYSNFFIDINNMTLVDNEYGINNNEVDSHMMKNMEFGGMAYLMYSKYGRCLNNVCTEIFDGDINEQNVNSTSTGNIYGVYMSMVENVMGGTSQNGASISEFHSQISSKYYDIYVQEENSDFTGHLGDGMAESDSVNGDGVSTLGVKGDFIVRGNSLGYQFHYGTVSMDYPTRAALVSIK